MKQFFNKKIEWSSPLQAYRTLRERCDFLLYSGTDAGTYSFIPLDAIEKKEIFSDEKESFNRLQNKHKELQKNYNLHSLNNWKYPFCGGINAYFSYEYTQKFNKNIWNKNELKNSLCFYTVNETFLVFDHKHKKVFISGWFEDESFFLQFSQRIEIKLQASNKNKGSKKIISTKFSHLISKKEYLLQFEKVQQEIEKGNSFQVNFSQGFTAQTKNDPFDIFCIATEKNPAPMMSFCEWKTKDNNNKSIISCSPERLFSQNTTGKIWTQPIAGTRPRGKNNIEDDIFSKELQSSKKEQAEHSMLVDLLRNDFGKVSKFGSVQVVNFARIEKYKTVIHLVSDIEGICAENKSAFDVFTAVFPGGTITGAPKQETMKILQRIEKRERGAYCGSMGYFSFDGQADFNILIRTLEYTNRELYGRAGGGIVWGADGKSEYKESLDKWRGIEKIFENQ